MGIVFNGVGQGESVVSGRFQAERVTHEWLWEGQEDWPAEERTHLHREVLAQSTIPGCIKNSMMDLRRCIAVGGGILRLMKLSVVLILTGGWRKVRNLIQRWRTRKWGQSAMHLLVKNQNIRH